MNKCIINNVLYEVVKPTDMRMVKVKSLSGEFVIGYLNSFYYDYIEDFYYLNGVTFDPDSVEIYNEE